MTYEELVLLLNKLILEAIVHGADMGGSYDQNEAGLFHAMDDIAKAFNLYDKYKISEINVERCGAVWLRVMQFIKKENKE